LNIKCAVSTTPTSSANFLRNNWFPFRFIIKAYIGVRNQPCSFANTTYSAAQKKLFKTKNFIVFIGFRTTLWYWRKCERRFTTISTSSWGKFNCYMLMKVRE